MAHIVWRTALPSRPVQTDGSGEPSYLLPFRRPAQLLETLPPLSQGRRVEFARHAVDVVGHRCEQLHPQADALRVPRTEPGTFQNRTGPAFSAVATMRPSGVKARPTTSPACVSGGPSGSPVATSQSRDVPSAAPVSAVSPLAPGT